MKEEVVAVIKGEIVYVKLESACVKDQNPKPVIELMEAANGKLLKEGIHFVKTGFLGVRWTQLNLLSAREVLTKLRRKRHNALKRLTTILLPYHVFQFLD